MSDYIKDEIWKLEVTNKLLKDYVIQYIENELTRCLLIQNLNLQGRILNNIKEVLDNGTK